MTKVMNQPDRDAMQAWADSLKAAAEELLRVAKAEPGDLLVVGCSTSEVHAAKIGTDSVPELGAMLAEAVLTVCREHGIHLAAQCCEHLNRALVVDADVGKERRYCRVHAIPQPKAGGSFATAVWQAMEKPWLVDRIEAEMGLDIGDTFIGMHLRPVAVPVRLGTDTIGHAHLTAARTRIPFTGGARAVYDPELL